MEKIDILSLSLSELEYEILKLDEKKFRAKQIFEWLHIKKADGFGKMTNISSALRTKLESYFCIKPLNIKRKLESCIDNTVKYLYELSDGNFIETVLMDYKHGYSLCVSTQVGCKMGCSFCASTKAGFVRNLYPSEILQQIYCTEKDSGKKISGIVLMGIGEPFDNFDNIIKFFELVSLPNGYNMSLRHVTVSTCGLVPKIYELAEKKLGLTLSISLHASDDRTRSEIMPVNKSYNIEELIKACRYYVDVTGRRITFEYAVIDKINSSKQKALSLAKLVKGINCHINLIPVNKIKENNFSSIKKNVQDFKNNLESQGINVTVRRTLGSDINAACGQLRRNEMI